MPLHDIQLQDRNQQQEGSRRIYLRFVHAYLVYICLCLLTEYVCMYTCIPNNLPYRTVPYHTHMSFGGTPNHEEQVAIRGLKIDLLLCTFALRQTNHGLEEAPSLQLLKGIGFE